MNNQTGSSFIKVFIKRALLVAAGLSGALHLLRFRQRNRIVIFMLHGIVEEKEYAWHPLRKQCSLRRFEQVLCQLKKIFTFVSLEEAVDMLSGRLPMRPYSAVLTFDDGYKNNCTTALPVLSRLSLPAVFFLPTGLVDSKKPLWFDFLDYMIQHGSKEKFALSMGEKIIEFDLRKENEVKKQFRRFLYLYNNKYSANDISFQKRLIIQLEKLQVDAGVNYYDFFLKDEQTALMSWKDAIIAAKNGVCIGSHTVDHVKLSTLEQSQQCHQLQQSKKDIERQVQASCRYLSYPNGSYDVRVIRNAGKCGFKAAVTTEAGLNDIGVDVFRLSRISFPVRANKFHILSHIYGRRN